MVTRWLKYYKVQQIDFIVENHTGGSSVIFWDRSWSAATVISVDFVWTCFSWNSWNSKHLKCQQLLGT